MVTKGDFEHWLKNNVVKFIIRRVEGPMGIPSSGDFTTLEGADSFLYNMAMGAPELSYWKTDVTLELKNGKSKRFRIDLQQNRDNTIEGNLMRMQNFYEQHPELFKGGYMQPPITLMSPIEAARLKSQGKTESDYYGSMVGGASVAGMEPSGQAEIAGRYGEMAHQAGEIRNETSRYKVCEFLKKKITEEQEESIQYVKLQNEVLALGYGEVARIPLMSSQQEEIQFLKEIYRRVCE